MFDIKSMKEIKYVSQKLDDDLNDAKELDTQTYPNKYKELEDAISELKKSKQEYENKSKYSSEDAKIGAVEIKTYKIHYLWTVLGNYRKEDKLKSLNLDLKTTRNIRCI